MIEFAFKCEMTHNANSKSSELYKSSVLDESI